MTPNKVFSIEPQIVYRIRNSEGKYSSGGTRPVFRAKGKIWSSIGALKNHLHLVLKRREPQLRLNWPSGGWSRVAGDAEYGTDWVVEQITLVPNPDSAAMSPVQEVLPEYFVPGFSEPKEKK